MKNLITRTVTGIFFVAAIVVCFMKPLAMTALFALVTALTTWEYCGLVNAIKGVQVNRLITTVASTYLFVAITGFCCNVVTAAAFIPYLLTIVYLLVSGLYNRTENPVNDWAYTMLAQLYIALPLSTVSCLAFCALPDGTTAYTQSLPLSVFIFLWASDTGAYCCGSLFGKHRLFPRISPKKSWEGSVGGAIVAIVAAVVISLVTGGSLSGHTPQALADGQQPVLTTIQWIGLALVVVVFGTWGDLVESLFKRTLGVKDSGTILPGHGGMLDRFDSSLLAFPAALIYIHALQML